MNCIQQLLMKVYFTRSFIFLRAAGFHAAQSDSTDHALKLLLQVRSP